MPVAAATTSPRHVVVDSPLGPLTLVRDDGGLTGLYYLGHWTRPDRNSFGPHVDSDQDHGFDEAIVQLTEYFAGERRGFDLPLNPRGSVTARKIWQLLANIGGVSPRDVGRLVGDNPLSILIPCHRVLGSTGKLTGYAGGLSRKRYLLQLEQAVPPSPQGL
jgi:methylated-DNA-[protein]-cysteine S-methyltransferase